MVVICHARLVAHDIPGVSCPPRSIHELDGELLVIGDIETRLDVSDLGIGGSVVIRNEVIVIALRLVDDFEHARGAVRVIRVNALSHCREKLVGAVILVGLKEARRVGELLMWSVTEAYMVGVSQVR